MFSEILDLYFPHATCPVRLRIIRADSKWQISFTVARVTSDYGKANATPADIKRSIRALMLGYHNFPMSTWEAVVKSVDLALPDEE